MMPCECCGQTIHKDGCEVESALLSANETIVKVHKAVTDGVSVHTYKVLLQVLEHRRVVYDAMIAMYGPGSAGVPGVHEAVENGFTLAKGLLEKKIFGAVTGNFLDIELDPAAKTFINKLPHGIVQCHYVGGEYSGWCVSVRAHGTLLEHKSPSRPKKVVGRIYPSADPANAKPDRLQLWISLEDSNLVCVRDTEEGVIPTTMSVDFGLGESETVITNKAVETAAEYVDKEIAKILGGMADMANVEPPKAHGHFGLGDEKSSKLPEFHDNEMPPDPSDDMEPDDDDPDPYETHEPCTKCDGTGYENAAGTKCNRCEGTGVEPDPSKKSALPEEPKVVIEACDKCGGKKCPACQHTGLLAAQVDPECVEVVDAQTAGIADKFAQDPAEAVDNIVLMACEASKGKIKHANTQFGPGNTCTIRVDAADYDAADQFHKFLCSNGLTCLEWTTATGPFPSTKVTSRWKRTKAPDAEPTMGKVFDTISKIAKEVEGNSELKKTIVEEMGKMLASTPTLAAKIKFSTGDIPAIQATLSGILLDVPNITQVQAEKVQAMVGYDAYDITIGHTGDLDPALVSGRLKPFGLTLESWTAEILGGSQTESTSKGRYRYHPLLVGDAEKTAIDGKWTQFKTDEKIVVGDLVYLKLNGWVTRVGQMGTQVLGVAAQSSTPEGTVAVSVVPAHATKFEPKLDPQAHLHLEGNAKEVFIVKGAYYAVTQAMAPGGYDKGYTYLTLKKINFHTGIAQPLEVNMVLRAHFPSGHRDYVVEYVGADTSKAGEVYCTARIRPIGIPAEPQYPKGFVQVTEAGGVLFMGQDGKAYLGIQPDGRIVVNPQSKMRFGDNILDIADVFAQQFWKTVSDFNPLLKRVKELEADLGVITVDRNQVRGLYAKLSAEVAAEKAERAKPPPFERTEAAKLRFENVAKKLKTPEETA